jgi:peptidoglycan/xylan/chitin deacetylase (PgdA/CDA1 family)
MSVDSIQPYGPDRSVVGKLRRRLVKLYARRPARRGPQDRPWLSVTFDDAPTTATTVGAEILKAHGAKGAYYISAGLLGLDGHMGPYAEWSDVERLHAEGHEIGCHTLDHTDLGPAGAEITRDAVSTNRAALEAHGIPSPTTFAYPYGDVSFAPKAVLAPRFDLLRALHHGVIERGVDLNQAPSVGMEGPEGEQTARTWLRRAAERKAWLILTAHDVQAQPSPWGCTPDALRRIVKEAVDRGFEIITVAEGARRVA